MLMQLLQSYATQVILTIMREVQKRIANGIFVQGAHEILVVVERVKITKGSIGTNFVTSTISRRMHEVCAFTCHDCLRMVIFPKVNVAKYLQSGFFLFILPMCGKKRTTPGASTVEVKRLVQIQLPDTGRPLRNMSCNQSAWPWTFLFECTTNIEQIRNSDFFTSSDIAHGREGQLTGEIAFQPIRVPHDTIKCTTMRST